MITQPSPGLIADLAGLGLEDAATETLAELLRDQVIQRRFLERLAGVSDPPLSTVVTQVANTTEPGRPDITMTGRGLRVLVESKIGAPLTAQQPDSYVRELQRAGREGTSRAVLVFLVPSGRRAAIDAEVATRVQTVGEGLRVEVRVKTWQDVLGILPISAELDQPLRWLATAFRELVHRRICHRVELGPEELRMLVQPDALTAFVALHDLVLALKDHLTTAGYTTGGFERGELAFGFSVWQPERMERAHHIGYDHRTTERLQLGAKCPLWLNLYGSGYDAAALHRLRTASYHVIDTERRRPPILALPLADLLLRPERSGSAGACAHIGDELARIHACASAG